MKEKKFCWMVVLMVILGLSQATWAVIIEPDNFADETVLTQVSPGVRLSVTTSNNQIVDIWSVTADIDSMGDAPTGTMVFGHNDIPFWNSDRHLRVDFTQPAAWISLMAGGTDYFDYSCQGRLEVYDMNFKLLEVYLTAPLREHQNETMLINRSQNDIYHAIAYTVGEDPFGRLDRLGYAIPEPATLSMLLIGAAGVLLKRNQLMK
jgi:hypothetical protein